MKISKIVERPLSEVNKMKRFDLQKPVKKQARILQPVAWIVALPETIKRKLKITKIGMQALKKEPYLLLCNHNSFYDFKVAMRAIMPRRATYVVTVDGFINREWIMRQVGCFGKRKFVNDITVIKQLKRSLFDLKHITMLYPEARYSLIGQTMSMPDSLGKLIKRFNVPVATLVTQGNHLAQPVWNLRPRKLSTTATMTYLITKEESQSLSINEINERIKEALTYDDFKWQRENKIKITEPWRAEGIESVLYQCPECETEGSISAKGHTISCDSCGSSWKMDEYGVLHATKGKTRFSHIPDWYEWQRLEVEKQVLNKTYHFEHDVNVNMLPNSKGYIQIGQGKLVHNLDGFKVTGNSFGEPFEFVKNPLETYAIHIELNYFGRGHGIGFSTYNDTYFMFSKEKTYLATKVQFAVEEIYKIKSKEKENE